MHTSRAGDWPAYGRDGTRNAAAAETLAVPLAQAWVFAAPHPPRPAWPSTARQDIWHELTDLPHVVAYDRVFHAIAAGDRVYFGSSADDKVYALDAGTGEVRWTFFTEGPVRLAPAYAQGRLYVGSDDGCVYCVDAATGALVWTHRAAVSARRIPGNGRLVSDMPVRAGVLVDGDTVYACAGLFPPKAALACALDARTGAPRWSRLLESVSPQGYLSASPARLFVPTGRTSPAVLDRAAGEYLGAFEGDGGTEIVFHAGILFHGPGRHTGEKLAAGDPATLARGGELPGVRAVFAGEIAYLQSKRELSALRYEPYLVLSRRAAQLRGEREKAVEAFKREPEGDRKRAAAARAGELAARIAEAVQAMQQCVVWTHTTACTTALLLAGDTLIAGGDGAVVALAAADGRVLWTAEVQGCAYGLAAARGRLFASTDKGVIHCFAPAAQAGADVRAPAPASGEAPAPRDVETARRILATSGVTKGWCLVLGSGEGRLVRALAAASDLAIVGLERDPGKVARSRAALDAAGLYGPRAAILMWEGDRIPCTDYIADLVVADAIRSDGTPPAELHEILRVTRPAGG
ncbi:MAG TPA: hypothetical protein DCM87_05335, partial [Planctomycetes bacterium]|nr:hypothetical protein [Planctomycetota bacterium]